MYTDRKFFGDGGGCWSPKIYYIVGGGGGGGLLFFRIHVKGGH